MALTIAVARAQVYLESEVYEEVANAAVEQFVNELMADMGARMRIERIRCETTSCMPHYADATPLTTPS